MKCAIPGGRRYRFKPGDLAHPLELRFVRHVKASHRQLTARLQRVKLNNPLSLHDEYVASNWQSVAVALKENSPNIRPRYLLPERYTTPSCSVAVMTTEYLKGSSLKNRPL